LSAKRDSLNQLRNKIQAIDQKILDLLHERAEIVIEIGRLKKNQHLPVYDPQRESALLDLLIQNNKSPLSAEAITNIFRAIMDELKNLQQVTNHQSSS
jgi:chorismate mutase-like protein